MTFAKYPKIYPPNREENEELLKRPEDDILIQEKIDGANFRFTKKNGKIIFGSRNQTLGDDNSEIGGNWKRCTEHIKKAFENNKEKFQEGYIFYGECTTKHTMNYNWEEIPPFLGFDIYNIKEKTFIQEPHIMFKKIGLTPIPTICLCKASAIKELIKSEELIPTSKYANELAEGVVLKNYRTQTFAKIVRAKFKEKNNEVFGINRKWAEDDSERITAMYCNNTRIDKTIFKLIDEGNKLDIKLMQTLPKRVINDIYEENYKEICNSNWSINFRRTRRLMTKRCLKVLKQVIENNKIQKMETK